MLRIGDASWVELHVVVAGMTVCNPGNILLVLIFLFCFFFLGSPFKDSLPVDQMFATDIKAAGYIG